MRVQRLILYAFCMSFSLSFSYAQTEKEVLEQISTLKDVKSMPYICREAIEDPQPIITENGDTIYFPGCGDNIYWNCVKLREKAIQPLIDRMTDTTRTDAHVMLFGGYYTVADIAYVALTEIIHGIPTFDLLGVKFSEECGYCAYWFYVNDGIKNRRKFQKAVQKWYDKNKNMLVWIENNDFETCDCFGKHPAGGHFELQKPTGEISAVSYLKSVSALADSITISTVHYDEKEMQIPVIETITGEIVELPQDERTYILQTSELTKKEANNFNSDLNNSGSTIALPDHHDIELSYYVNDSVYSKVFVSSITRKISIVNTIECDDKGDLFQHLRTTSCLFVGEISTETEKYLTQLLRRKKLWNRSQIFFVW